MLYLFDFRFWTMAKTFTGLKLQGELGRFGTTELSDISGNLFLMLVDIFVTVMVDLLFTALKRNFPLVNADYLYKKN